MPTEISNQQFNKIVTSNPTEAKVLVPTVREALQRAGRVLSCPSIKAKQQQTHVLYFTIFSLESRNLPCRKSRKKISFSDRADTFLTQFRYDRQIL